MPSPSDLMSTPAFIREREAWFKAGVTSMTGYSAISCLVAGIAVSLATIFIDLNAPTAAICTAVAGWGLSACCSGLLTVTARRRAMRGGVTADPI